MPTLASSLAIGGLSLPVGSTAGLPRSPAEQFGEIFLVFAGLGTLVGIVVIGYTMYNALKYRDGNGRETEEYSGVVRPSLGELPTSSGGGKKLFVSFGISAVIVVSLILWTYSALLYVDNGEPAEREDALEIDVVGQQFSWIFVYPNGHESTTLRVPKDRPVRLNVTSEDVMHNIGIPAFNAKTDAIPGQTTTTWFVPDRTGTFEASCYELCGSGHSVMTSDVIVMDRDEYREWYEGTTEENGTATDGDNGTAAAGDDADAENGTDSDGERNAIPVTDLIEARAAEVGA